MDSAPSSAAQSLPRVPQDFNPCAISSPLEDVEQGNAVSLPGKPTLHASCVKEWQRRTDSRQICSEECRAPVSFSERLKDVEVAEVSLSGPLDGSVSDITISAGDDDTPPPNTTNASLEVAPAPVSPPSLFSQLASAIAARQEDALWLGLGGVAMVLESAMASALGGVSLRTEPDWVADPKLLGLEALVGALVITPVVLGATVWLIEKDRGSILVPLLLGSQPIGSPLLGNAVLSGLEEHANVSVGDAALAAATGQLLLAVAACLTSLCCSCR